jgi:hypothetical protein
MGWVELRVAEMCGSVLGFNSRGTQSQDVTWVSVVSAQYCTAGKCGE